MVETIRSDGLFYLETIDSLKQSFKRYLLWRDSRVYPPTRNQIILERLEELHPDYYVRSKLLLNTDGPLGRKLDVLLVPHGCPNLYPEDTKPTAEMPQEGTIFYITFWSRHHSDLKHPMLFICDSDVDARDLAVACARRQHGIVGKNVRLESFSVTVGQFRDLAVSLIDKGIWLEKNITKYCDLAKYQREAK